jgi:endonuclease YncB( thermonuclease family)
VVCRLYGIDAPEVKQPLWEAARQALAELMVHDP